jgi:RecA-family ATPase
MDEILSALSCIPVKDCSYAEWLGIGMALKDAGYECAVWDEWSQNDERYIEGDCERRWATFKGSERPVTVRTIRAMARRNGWISAFTDFEDTDELTSCDMLIRYLETLFQPNDIVGYATQVKQDSHGKLKPINTNLAMKASTFIEQLRGASDIGDIIGPYRADCGAWIRMNPLDGQGQSDSNVSAHRYVLIESDTLPKDKQERFYRKYELPIACMVDSAGKSIHAVVRIDAPNEQEYRKRVNYLFRFMELRGFPVDNANKNPSRLSRMPGIPRDGILQELLATNIGKHSWREWLEYAEELSLLPEPIRLSDIETPPPKPPELIRGILRRGHKMLIAGPSKAGKSFLLIELAIAIAEGRTWLGFSCTQGRVLYVNLEIDPASCIDRFATIYSKLSYTPPHMENIVIWNLRGHALPLDKLVPILVKRMKDEDLAAVIIDPIYKVITGDENNASDMGSFCNQFDKICTEMGASAIYCHHHSKGAQGGKKAMDRASGSGVFARDPDAQLDIIELKKPLFKEVETETEDGEVVEIEQFDTTLSAWRLEASLREFPPITPVNFYFDYPLHPLDTEGVLSTYQPDGSGLANLALSTRKSTPEMRQKRLDDAFNAASEDGIATVKSMAEFADVSVETIRRYLKEFPDDYIVKNGVVLERPLLDDSTAKTNRG